MVVDPSNAKKYADKVNMSPIEDVVKDSSFKQAVYDDMMRLANENKFNSLEKPRQLTLLLDPWTVENDMLTPTSKLKRNVAKINY